MSLHGWVVKRPVTRANTRPENLGPILRFEAQEPDLEINAEPPTAMFPNWAWQCCGAHPQLRRET
jgi:hypothetical protein